MESIVERLTRVTFPQTVVRILTPQRFEIKQCRQCLSIYPSIQGDYADKENNYGMKQGLKLW